MKYLKLLVLLLSFSVSLRASQPPPARQGSICIPAQPGSSESTLYDGPPMSPPDVFIGPGGPLQIQVDKRKPVTVSNSSGAAIKGLALKGKHLLKIRLDGKVKQSFWFSFEKEGEKALCLWYYKGYGTFTLRPAKECRCSK